MEIKRQAIALIILFLPAAVCGQTAASEATVRIVGRVVDATRHPIPAVEVQIRVRGVETVLAETLTGDDGRFAIPATPFEQHTLRFETPGFVQRTGEFSTGSAQSITSIGDVVLQVGGFLGDYASPDPSPIPSQLHGHPGLPSDLIAQVNTDFSSRMTESCFNRHGVRLEESVWTYWLSLQSGGEEAALVEGLGPCFPSVTNRRKVLYRQVDDGWTAILTIAGQRLEPLETQTNGWHDIALWQHDTSYQSIRYLYQYRGEKYSAVACDVVVFRHWGTGDPLPEPKASPCVWDWKESRD